MIPKIIHQIWIGDKEKPEFMDKWREMNPSYEYILWDNDTIKALFPIKTQHLYDLYDNEKSCIWNGRANLLRLDILERFGGIYIDADCDPIRPLPTEGDFLDLDFFSCYINEAERGDRLANGIIGCCKNDRIISDYIDVLVKEPKLKQPSYIFSGPVLFTEVAKARYNDSDYNTKILPSYYFLPTFFKDNIKYEGDFQPYCDHKWGSTKHTDFKYEKIGILEEKDKPKSSDGLNKLSYRRRLKENNSYRRKRKKKSLNSAEFLEINSKAEVENSFVSVIITAYNSNKYIYECIKSITKQDFFNNNDNYEILVAVDGCKKTLDSLLEFKKEFENLRVFWSEKNVGTYILRNTLVYKSKGEYMLFFDSDDVLNDGVIRELMSLETKEYIRIKYKNFSDNHGHLTGRATTSMGCFWLSRRIFDRIGGFQPWFCSADTEFKYRAEYNNIISKTLKNDFSMFRRMHGNNLTTYSQTKMSSLLRHTYHSIIKNTKHWDIPIVPVRIDLEEFR